jgi:hypothetical protein
MWDFVDTNVETMRREFKMVSAKEEVNIISHSNPDEYVMYAKASDMENAFRKIFGPDSLFEHGSLEENFRDICGQLGLYDSKKQIYHDNGPCGGEGGPVSLHAKDQLIAAKQDSEAIYVYSHYAYVLENNEKYYFFTKLPVLDVDYIENSTNDKIISTPTAVGTYNDLDEGFNKLSKEGKLKTYKYTFKKQSDGKHYFYRGDIVEIEENKKP